MLNIEESTVSAKHECKKNILLIGLSFHLLWLHAHSTSEATDICCQDSAVHTDISETRIHIRPRENFKREFSYMGIPLIASGLIVKKKNEDFLKDFRKKEAIEVAERIVYSLNTILKNSIYNDVYFETGYSKSLLSKLRRLYYYKKIVDADTKDFELSFLKRKKIKGLPLFCAPKLAEAHNQATDLPFFGVGGMNVFAIFLINNACKTITHGFNIHFSILRK